MTHCSQRPLYKDPIAVYTKQNGKAMSDVTVAASHVLSIIGSLAFIVLAGKIATQNWCCKRPKQGIAKFGYAQA
jgi:hypothetical protein